MKGFTDEQLLNLVNNTIRTKTDFNPEQFTGGSVQITSTHNYQITKYKVALFFGYDNTKNSISKAVDIDEDLVFIWTSALLLKLKSMQASKNGMNYVELNMLMTQIEQEKEVIQEKELDNKIIDIDRVVTKSSRSRHEDDKFNFTLPKLTAFSNLSALYKQQLEKEINTLEGNMSYEDFALQLEAKEYKYKNFLSAYKVWERKEKEKYPSPRQKKTNLQDLPLEERMEEAERIRQAKIDDWWAREHGL